MHIMRVTPVMHTIHVMKKKIWILGLGYPREAFFNGLLGMRLWNVFGFGDEGEYV